MCVVVRCEGRLKEQQSNLRSASTTCVSDNADRIIKRQAFRPRPCGDPEADFTPFDVEADVANSRTQVVFRLLEAVVLPPDRLYACANVHDEPALLSYYVRGEIGTFKLHHAQRKPIGLLNSGPCLSDCHPHYITNGRFDLNQQRPTRALDCEQHLSFINDVVLRHFKIRSNARASDL